MRVASSRGEWSVADLVRGYRVCSFHENHHGGVHLHHPEDGPALGLVDLRGPGEAEAVMRLYALRCDVFDAKRFHEEVRRWRSGSSGA